jgi:hypothetical protein
MQVKIANRRAGGNARPGVHAKTCSPYTILCAEEISCCAGRGLPAGRVGLENTERVSFRSVLGYPTSDTSIPQDKVGRYSHFQRGMIWWNPSGGVHVVMGGILDQWKSMRYERSRLGYPTSDEAAAPDRRGRIQQFQGGTIYWSPQTGARVQ